MNNIKMYRGEAGLTQKELAERIGMTRANVILLENSQSKCVSKKSISKISEVLNVTPIQLLGKDNFVFQPENVEDIKLMMSLLEEKLSTLIEE